MTIQSTIERVTFAGDNVSTVFPIPIQAYLASDFTVQKVAVGGGVATLVLNSDYNLTVTGTLAPTQWTLTKTTALLTGETLAVFANPQLVQQTQYVTGQAFPSLAVQTNFDRLTQMVQRVSDQITRTVHAPDADTAALALPAQAIRANTYLTFDSSGNAQVAVSLPSGTLSQGSIGILFLPQTPAESNAGVVPVNYAYVAGDVRRYGALTTDVIGNTNATAFNAATLQASQTNGAAVRVPTGIFLVNAVISLYSNVQILSDRGGTINLNVADWGLKIPATATNIWIDGLTITGTSSRPIGTVTNANVSSIRITRCDISGATLIAAGYSSGIFIDGGVDCWIEDNYLHGNGRGPQNGGVADNNDIMFWYPNPNQRITVINNHCTSTQVSANIVFYTLQDSVIAGNEVSGADCQAGAPNGGYGILVYDQPGNTSFHNMIVNNTVKNTGGTGIYSAYVQGNTGDLIISGNVCVNNCLHQGTVSVALGGIAFNSCTGFVLTNNLIHTQTKNGINLALVTDGVISGNTINGCTGSGILLQSTMTRVSVADNVVTSCAGNIVTDAAPILTFTAPVASGATTATLAAAWQAGGTGTYHVYFVETAGGALEERVVTLTFNATTATWATALGANCNAGATVNRNYLKITNNLTSLSTGGIQGLLFQGLDDSDVSGNSAINGSGVGISITSGSRNRVSNNLCIDNSTNAANASDGILISSNNTQIIANRSGNSVATGQRYGINSTGNYNTVLNNDLTNNQTSGYSITGTTPKAAGNRLAKSVTPGLTEGVSAAMVAGTITISTNEIISGDNVSLSHFNLGSSNLGHLYVSAFVAGTSFTVTSSNGADTSNVAWQIIH